MTLCVAWRFEHRISLAADSMLGTSVGHKFDIAPKLFAIPTRVLGPVDEKTKVPYGNTYTHTLALSYTSEDLTRAAVFKEVFSGICSSLQYLGDPSTMPFERFVTLAQKVYELVMKKARESSELASLPDMFIAGWCGHSQRVRVFKLLENPDGSCQPTAHECCISEHHFAYDCLGAGSAAMRAKVEAHDKRHHSIHVNMLRWFQELIDNREVASVGGPLQFGDFPDRDFIIHGLVYPPKQPYGQPRLVFFNLEIDDLKQPAQPDSLHVTGNFALPFND